jgi:hypothetical protein
MAELLTAIQKLDIVLRFISARPEAKPCISRDDLFRQLTKENAQLKKETEFGSDLERILDKLIAEKYVQIELEPYLPDEAPFGQILPPKRFYKITFDGRLLVDSRKSYESVIADREKREQLIRDQIQSTIQANLSSKHINEVVIPRFNKRQTNLTWLTLGIATLSLAAISISAFYARESVTGKQLQQLTKAIQDSHISLNKMQQSQSGIDSSLRKAVTDSFYRK